MSQDRNTAPPPPAVRSTASTLALLLKSDFGRLNPERARVLASRSANPPSEPEGRAA